MAKEAGAVASQSRPAASWWRRSNCPFSKSKMLAMSVWSACNQVEVRVSMALACQIASDLKSQRFKIAAIRIAAIRIASDSESFAAEGERPSWPRGRGHHGREVEAIVAEIRILGPPISEFVKASAI